MTHQPLSTNNLVPARYNHAMTLQELRENYRDEILRLAERYGARNVRVFGSVARGDAQPGSDVDFLVEFEPGRSLFDHGGLYHYLEELLGCHVDVVSAVGLKAHLRDAVLQEAVPL
jgi:uncharacterized protein